MAAAERHWGGAGASEARGREAKLSVGPSVLRGRPLQQRKARASARLCSTASRRAPSQPTQPRPSALSAARRRAPEGRAHRPRTRAEPRAARPAAVFPPRLLDLEPLRVAAPKWRPPGWTLLAVLAGDASVLGCGKNGQVDSFVLRLVPERAGEGRGWKTGLER